MSHGQRHTACKLCREKKVRCDGEQPACSKCLRSGEQCIYEPIPVPTRATLANMVQDLRERLERAEAQIPSVQPYQRNYSPQSCLPDFDPCIYSINASPSGPFAAALMAAPPQPSSSVDFGVSRYDTSDFIMLSETQNTSEDEMNRSMMGQQSHDKSHTHSQRPSTCELSPNLGQAADPTSSRSSAPSSNAGPSPALDAVKEFVLRVSATQEEKSCRLGAVAEHLAWAITLPGTDRRSAKALNVLIARLSETRHASDASICLSYQRLCSSLEMVTGWGGPVADLETHMQKDKARIRNFFESEFNIFLPLSAQRLPTSLD